jgi:CMP/dCMP kinase
VAVITISRQLGSMGCEVAQAVAAHLGYSIAWREVINEAARRAGVPGIALHAIDELGLLGYKPTMEEQKAYHEALGQVMNELADRGDIVIVGRAGQAILQHRPDVFHIRVIAPITVRIQRLTKEQSISPQAAEAQIGASDRSRRTFLKRFYQVEWDNPDLYDLLINTGRVSVQTAAELVYDLCLKKTSATHDASPD